MSFLLIERGVKKLSELEIDTDKDWAGKGITNIQHIAHGSSIGHVAQHNGTVLETLPPGVANYVLTSAGPGNRVIWMPAGMYLNRYIPEEIDLEHGLGLFVPVHSKPKPAPVGLNIGLTFADGDLRDINPTWFKTMQPQITVPLSCSMPSPAYADAHSPAVSLTREYVNPVSGGILDDGGALSDETGVAKSELTRDQSYETGDDSNQGFSSATYWQAQTFTTGLSQRIRGVYLKMSRSGTPGSTVVSIYATDGSGHPTGIALCQGSLDGNTVQFPSSYPDWFWVPMANGIILANATKYAIVVQCAASGLYWRCDSSSPTYSGGNREYSSNAGVSWTTDLTQDFMFRTVYTLDDMDLLPPAGLAVNDAWYWGYDAPFDRIYQDVSIAGAGTYTLAFEYSKGGGVWGSCVALIDGTNAFQNLWLNVISHSRQPDWIQDTVSGKTLYWLRARVTDAGVGYVQPKGSYAKAGIDW